MKYYIDIRNKELYEISDVCINLSRKNIFGQAQEMKLPETAIEFKPKIKKCYKLLVITKNPIKNFKLFFDNELNLYIQSEEWLRVCKILKFKLNIGLKPAKILMDIKIRGIKRHIN